MAKPRVFVSSTFYNLRQVREDLDNFITTLGYESVLFEEGDIAYGKERAPEGYVHREIGSCEILVCIIGGRYGSESQEQPGSSITQLELKTAIDNQIQVFVFVEQNAYSEYRTYLINKETVGMKYQFVDDPRVYEFIESVYNLPRNNPITPFQTASDIVEFLKNQWAGLFQRFLQDQKRLDEIRTLSEMKSVAEILQQLLPIVVGDGGQDEGVIQQVLVPSHPAFRAFQGLTNTTYRVFFTDEQELNQWLRASGWRPVSRVAYDEGSYREWINTDNTQYIRLSAAIFDENGRLKTYAEHEWEDSWLQLLFFADED